MTQSNISASEALIREVDTDRYLAGLFAPVGARLYLFALYAFHYEIAKTAESVSQPVLGQMRLQWWRDAVDTIFEGRVPDHDVARSLAVAVQTHRLSRVLIEGMIDARERDLDDMPFAEMAELESYVDATSGHVMRLAARILGAESALDEAAGHAGIAYGLCGLLRALPYHASGRRLMMPTAVMVRADVSPEDIFAGQASEGLAAVIAQIADRARFHLQAARGMKTARQFLPALLPAAIVPRYLDVMTRRGFNPFRDVTEVPVYRRQLAMLSAMLRGRV